MKKNYSYPHTTMVLSAKILCANFELLKSEFVKWNSNLNDDFIARLKNMVEKCLNILGINTKNEVKTLTLNVATLLEAVHSNIMKFRQGLRYAYRSDVPQLNLIVNHMQIDQICDASRIDRMFIALNSFVTGLLDYEEIFIQKGITEELVNTILTDIQLYMENYSSLNDNKGKAIVLTDDQQQSLNELFTETTAVGELGKVLFRNNREKAKLFAFSRIAASFVSHTRKAQDTSTNVTGEIEEAA